MERAKRKGKLTKLLQVWVSPEQYEAIKRLAGMSGSISKTVRILVTEALKARGETL
jgi:hypothetical protein